MIEFRTPYKCSVFFQIVLSKSKEESHSRGALQTGKWAPQGQRMSPGDDRAVHATVQVT